MSYQYDQYLVTHKTNVKKGYEWIRENLPELIESDKTIDYDLLIGKMHDFSKNDFAEYKAYDNYFYGIEKTPSIVDAFNKAWLTHIHRNPHHWQHWVLINDDPGEGTIAIEMPYCYVIEMICDWWSFSWSKGDLTEVFRWYDDHKSYIKLNNNTRSIVEEILGMIRAKIQAYKEDVDYGKQQ